MEKLKTTSYNLLINKSLDFFNDKILFPKKLEKANKMLKKIGISKIVNNLIK